jgi:diguanylate cyclase (GGDEF)-like protein/PAS domain S-box-containing protein
MIGALVCAGLASGVAAVAVRPRPPAPVASTAHWVLLGFAFVIAGGLTVDIRRNGEIDAFDVFEAALTPAIYFLPGLGVVLVVAATKAATQHWLRMPWIKLAFNVAQWTACAGIGALTFSALASDSHRAQDQLPALVAAMVVVAVVNLGTMVVLFSTLAGRSRVQRLLAPPELAWSSGLTAATVATGIGVTVAAADQTAALLLVVAISLALHWAGRGFAAAGADLDRLERLHAATRALAAALDPREDPTAFLGEVAHCCAAQVAELALMRDDHLETHRFDAAPDANDHATIGSHTAPVAVLFAAPLPAIGVADPRRSSRWRSARSLSALGPTSNAVTAALRAAGRRDCLAVPVTIDDTRIGALAVYDRSGFATVDAADLATLDSLAREVAAAVQRAQLVEEALGARRNATRIVNGSNDGIVALAEDGSVVTWNPAFETLTGEAAEHMLGAGTLRRLDARDSNGTTVDLEAWAGGGPLPDELRIRTRDGHDRWLSCSYARTTRDGSTGRLLVMMVRDVTELRRQRELIAMQRRVLELVAADEPPVTSLLVIAALIAGQIDGTAAVVLADGEPTSPLSTVFDQSSRPGRPMHQRDALLAALNSVAPGRWQGVAASGRPLILDILGPDVRRCWAVPVLESGQARVRCVLAVCPTAATDPDQHALEVLQTETRLAGICLERDAARTRLAHQASHDPLTGLPNRVLFLDRCERALQVARRRGEYAVVLFIDLDRFKVVNDSLGHDAGDRLLVAVAERLREAVRPFDTIARFGGDEFTVLCEELPAAEDAGIIADRVLALFAAPFHLQGREVFETASVGIALDRAPQHAEDLIQHADAAMYRAKAGGGNRHEFFDEKLGQQAQARLASYTGLRRAVGGREFEVYYQPMVALSNGALVGVEALARWRHPTRGLLQPDAFIDLAEETGLIVPLGTQVLRTALTEMTNTPNNVTRRLRISVNLSARQLTHPDLMPTIGGALADARVSPEQLSLEITETVLVPDSTGMRAAIAHLKQLGVSLCLDDFGTGHSSMDYLKLLPVDELKIERRFVAGFLTNHQDRAIVTAITHLAHDLGLRVVAEGIESAAQAARLREIGCDVGQGFYFGHPMPACDVLDLTGASSD